MSNSRKIRTMNISVLPQYIIW